MNIVILDNKWYSQGFSWCKFYLFFIFTQQHRCIFFGGTRGAFQLGSVVICDGDKVNKVAGWGAQITWDLNWPVINQLSLESFWSPSWICWLCLETTWSLTQSLNTSKELSLTFHRTPMLTFLCCLRKYHLGHLPVSKSRKWQKWKGFPI